MSRQSQPCLTLTITATAALTEARFVNAAGAVPAAAANSLGVARMSGAIGDRVPVDVLGTAIVEAGGAIAAGAQVEIDATGRAVTKAAGVAVGRTLEAAAGVGSFIEVLLLPN